MPVLVTVSVLSYAAASSALTVPFKFKLLAPAAIVMPLAPNTVEPVQEDVLAAPLFRLIVVALILREKPVKSRSDKACVAPTF